MLFIFVSPCTLHKAQHCSIITDPQWPVLARKACFCIYQAIMFFFPLLAVKNPPKNCVAVPKAKYKADPRSPAQFITNSHPPPKKKSPHTKRQIFEEICNILIFEGFKTWGYCECLLATVQEAADFDAQNMHGSESQRDSRLPTVPWRTYVCVHRWSCLGAQGWVCLCNTPKCWRKQKMSKKIPEQLVSPYIFRDLCSSRL